MIGAVITVIAWALTLAWMIGSLVRGILHDRAAERQIDALDALSKLPTASHRGGGRTR